MDPPGLLLLLTGIIWDYYVIDDRMSFVELIERAGFVTVYLAPETLTELPNFAFRKQSESVESGERCTICLDDYEDGEITMQLPCSRIFHRHCLTKSFETIKSCLLCKDDVVIQKNEDNPMRIDNKTKDIHIGCFWI